MSLVPHKDDPDYKIYKDKGLEGLEKARAKRAEGAPEVEEKADPKAKK